MVAFDLVRTFVIFALLAPATLAVPAANKTVITPFGEFPAANVHAVPEGGKLVQAGNEIRLTDAAGKPIHVAKNNGLIPANGWVAYAHWTDSGNFPIKYFTANWVVPPIPQTYHHQTIFLFNGLEPATHNAILQPVLQYGPSAAGGGAFWAVASWYVIGRTAYYTPLVSVNVGQSLHGAIDMIGTSGSSYNYNCRFTNIPGTTIILLGSPQLVWAAVTLETYNLNFLSDYPVGSTVFYPINVRTTNGVPSVTWTPVGGPITTVNIQGATNAKVTIKYP